MCLGDTRFEAIFVDKTLHKMFQDTHCWGREGQGKAQCDKKDTKLKTQISATAASCTLESRLPPPELEGQRYSWPQCSISGQASNKVAQNAANAYWEPPLPLIPMS